MRPKRTWHHVGVKVITHDFTYDHPIISTLIIIGALFWLVL